MKEIVQINYIKADTDFLKLGVEGSLNYFYQMMIIKAVQKPTMMIIIVVFMMMPKMRMIIWKLYTRLTAVICIDSIKRMHLCDLPHIIAFLCNFSKFLQAKNFVVTKLSHLKFLLKTIL